MSEETVLSWFGKGLPPVGTVCQLVNVERGTDWRHESVNGAKVTIVAHYDNDGASVAAFTVGQPGISFTVDSAIARNFEPIPTAESLAEKERERACRQMLDDVHHDISAAALRQAQRLYDSGWRKQVTP